ncbi:MAG: GvpL/GvpF family gas vesicle protein [Chloroflexi bacterium]|nr:GvpL/GvpF family gas vesicle protein [Chloroflexota bacterium]
MRYLLARLAEDRREAELRARAGAIARAVDEALCPYALERRCTVLPTPRLALRAAYLLEPVRIGAFWAAFEQVRRARPDLRCLLSGPWPPYSFVTPKVPGPTSNAQSPGFPLDFGPWTLE